MAHFSNFDKTYNKAFDVFESISTIKTSYAANRPKCILDFIFLAVLVKVCKHGVLLAASLHQTILIWTIANGSYLVLFINGGHLKWSNNSNLEKNIVIYAKPVLFPLGIFTPSSY